MQRSDLSRLAVELGFADIADELAGRAAMGYRLVPAPRGDRAGATRVGGRPDLPDGVSWPLGPDEAPMTFVGQVALDELPGDAPLRATTGAAVLSFFVSVDPITLAVEDPGLARVLTFAGDEAAALRTAAWPDALDDELRLAPQPATPTTELSLPAIGVRPAAALDGLGFEHGGSRYERQEDYWALEAALEERQGFSRHGPSPAPLHRLLGHPRHAQGDVFETLALYRVPGAGDAGAWRMLLQVSTDVGGIVVGVPGDDLAAGRVDRAQAASQSD